MRKVKVMTDSTADLPYGLMKEKGIELIPLHIILGDSSYPDDNSIKTTDLFAYADKHNTLPKTAAANEYQFAEAFGKWLGEGYDVIFIGISAKLSATVQNARNAREKFDPSRVSVIDSKSLSTGIGLQVLEASELAERGAGLAQITQNALKVRERVQASFVVDTLKYLYMGGRCSRLASIVGSRLKIKPELKLVDGEIVPGDKFRGANYVMKYFEKVTAEPGRIDPKRVFVTHCMSDQAEAVKNRLESEFGFKNVYITDASPTISTHCGPGTLGILYLYK